MSMTELERHLLNCLEEIQQELTSSYKFQDKRLTSLEEHQKKQEMNLEQLTTLLKRLEPLLKHLNAITEGR